MKFVDCVNRLMSAQGRGICMNPDHSQFKRKVTPRICLQCTTPKQTEPYLIDPEKAQKAHGEPPKITVLGTLIYTQTSEEPPPCPPGYERRSSDPKNVYAWVLSPIKRQCKHLSILPAEVGRCGYHRIKRQCQLVKSFVGPKTCTNCTIHNLERKPHD